MIPKTKPIRDRVYLDFIRAMPCLTCGRLGVEAHHEALKGNGTMGGKPGDDRTLPLCCYHHSFGGTEKHPGSRHGMGKLTGWKFWEAYGIDVEMWIIRLNDAFATATGRKVGEKEEPMPKLSNKNRHIAAENAFNVTCPSPDCGREYGINDHDDQIFDLQDYFHCPRCGVKIDLFSGELATED